MRFIHHLRMNFQGQEFLKYFHYWKWPLCTLYWLLNCLQNIYIKRLAYKDTIKTRNNKIIIINRFSFDALAVPLCTYSWNAFGNLPWTESYQNGYQPHICRLILQTVEFAACQLNISLLSTTFLQFDSFSLKYKWIKGFTVYLLSNMHKTL